MKTFIGACIAALAVAANPSAEKVDYLPGMGNFDTFGLYSGYIQLAGTRNIHYLFVEAKTNSATAPVLIWTNGGPGCSSLLGFTQENGPFSIASGATSPTAFTARRRRLQLLLWRAGLLVHGSQLGAR
jgi:hypothetical protein